MYDLQLADPAFNTWALLRQTWSVMDRVAETRLAKVGLTPEKIAVLWICRDYSGLATTAEIARFVSRRSQSVTGLLNRMEIEGLVTRAPKRKGRPFTEAKLTAKGEELCCAGIKVIKSLIAETAPVLSEEDREQLHTFLGALRQQAVEDLHIEMTRPPDFEDEEAVHVKW